MTDKRVSAMVRRLLFTNGLLLAAATSMAESPATCPPGVQLDSEQTMYLLQASRKYFDLEEQEYRDQIVADLRHDPAVAEEMAGLLGSTDAAYRNQVATEAARLYPERAPALLAALLTSRSWLDYDTTDELKAELQSLMTDAAPGQSAALAAVVASLDPHNAQTPVVDVSCAIERGEDAASNVLTVLGK